MSNILVWAEHDSGDFKKTAFELLGKATELRGDGEVMAVVLGDAPAASLGAYGASRVFHVAGDFSLFSGKQTADALHAAIQASGASVVLASSSYQAKDAMPRVAARMNSGMGSECTELRSDGGRVVGRRPAYAGKVFTDVNIASSPAFFTVRPRHSIQRCVPRKGTAESASPETTRIFQSGRFSKNLGKSSAMSFLAPSGPSLYCQPSGCIGHGRV